MQQNRLETIGAVDGRPLGQNEKISLRGIGGTNTYVCFIFIDIIKT